MGRLRSTGTRRLPRVLALVALAIGGIATWALATGPGGWDHLGDGGTPNSDSLNDVASALAATPGGLYVGGAFTNAGGLPGADRIAKWNGSTWSKVGSIPNGRVSAIAVAGNKVYAGGTFTFANEDASKLAVWDGVSWEPACIDSDPAEPAFDGNVTSLQVIDRTLYIGGEFQRGAHVDFADYLLACDLDTGSPRTTVDSQIHAFTGSVYALTADSNDTLYAAERSST